MVVTVHLHATLRMKTDDGVVDRLRLEVPDDATFRNLLDHLGLAQLSEHVVFVLNGRIAEVGEALADGDEIRLMPAISGG